MSELSKTKIEQAEQLHDQAMSYAEQAILIGRQRNILYLEYLRQAFDYERDAANLLADEPELEPSRSVLHRSAAALALECGEWRAAERLVGAALAGNPPDDMAEELRALLQKVYASRVHVTVA